MLLSVVVVRPALALQSPWLAASFAKQSNHITSRYLLETKSNSAALYLFFLCSACRFICSLRELRDLLSSD